MQTGYKAFRLVVRSSFVFVSSTYLPLGKINDVINFNQSQLLLAKTNEDRTTSRNALYQSYMYEIYFLIDTFNFI